MPWPADLSSLYTDASKDLCQVAEYSLVENRDQANKNSRVTEEKKGKADSLEHGASHDREATCWSFSSHFGIARPSLFI